MSYAKSYYDTHKEELSAYSREYYRKHYEERRKYNLDRGLEYTRRLRYSALEHYGGSPPKCVCCGEEEILFLTIDHANGTKIVKGHRSGNTLYRFLKQSNYPDGYRVLCFNCNCSIGNYGFCPHGSLDK